MLDTRLVHGREAHDERASPGRSQRPACLPAETTAGRRWFRTANGLLLPFPVFQMYYHPLITRASLWAVTFPGTMWYPAAFFHREAASTSLVSRNRDDSDR
jgi:hypothetical protein